MGIRDLLSCFSSAQSDDVLDPLLKAAGVEAAMFDYHPNSAQIVLALKVKGELRYRTFTQGKRYSRAEICAMLSAPPGDPQAHSPPP